jgi:hypothetical protein
MAGWRQAIELALSEEEVTRLTAVTRSPTEPASRVERARMLLAHRQDGSFLRSPGPSGCTIRPFSAASNEPWPLARWPRLMICRAGPEADNHGRGQGLGGESGVPQGQGARLSPRLVDDAAARGPCARTWAGRGARLPGQACSGHAVHHPQRTGDQALLHIVERASDNTIGRTLKKTLSNHTSSSNG